MDVYPVTSRARRADKESNGTTTRSEADATFGGCGRAGYRNGGPDGAVGERRAARQERTELCAPGARPAVREPRRPVVLHAAAGRNVRQRRARLEPLQVRGGVRSAADLARWSRNLADHLRRPGPPHDALLREELGAAPGGHRERAGRDIARPGRGAPARSHQPRQLDARDAEVPGARQSAPAATEQLHAAGIPLPRRDGHLRSTASTSIRRCARTYSGVKGSGRRPSQGDWRRPEARLRYPVRRPSNRSRARSTSASSSSARPPTRSPRRE